MVRLNVNGTGQHHSGRRGRSSRYGGCISFAERVATFWALVHKGGPNGCWLWMGRRDKNGYGHFHFNGKGILTHRFAWLATHGKFPDKPFLCHDCDNPSCCNPAHLFPGTNADNIRDAVIKGRMPKGETSPRAKFSRAQIIALRNSVWPRMVLAKIFGVHKSTIDRIKTRHRYGSVN